MNFSIEIYYVLSSQANAIGILDDKHLEDARIGWKTRVFSRFRPILISYNRIWENVIIASCTAIKVE